MTERREILIINKITARPERVHALACSVEALRQRENGAASTQLRQLVAWPDARGERLGDDVWKETLDIALELGLLAQEHGQLVPRTLFMETEPFKRYVRRRFQEYEAQDSPNAIIVRSYRVALTLPSAREDGLIDETTFVDAVNDAQRQAGRFSDVRALNPDKASAWLRWMRYLDLIVGANAFAPVLNVVGRRVIQDEATAIPREVDLPVRDFLALVEQEAACLSAPAATAENGELPASTAAMLTLLEAEEALKLTVVGDAPRWSFPGIGREVTHVRVTGETP